MTTAVPIITSQATIRFGMSLREGTLGPADRREVEVVCIRPGMSRNGNFYGPDCLRQAVPLFEGARAYVDHSAETLRSVRDLAGSYRNVRQGADGEVRATLRIAKSQQWLWDLIEESVQEGQDLVGLSIDVQAAVREGSINGARARIVERIDTVQSVDVITKASAGGSFEKILEADKQSWWDQNEPINEQAADIAAANIASGVPIVNQQRPVLAGQVNPVQFGPSTGQEIPGGFVQLGGSYVVQANGVTTIAGGAEPPVTTSPVAPPPQIVSVSQVQEGASAGVDVLADIRRERQLLASERLVESTLRGSDLPGVVRSRIERRLAGKVVDAARIAEAIEDERGFLAELTGAGMIRGMGYEKTITVGLSEADRLQKAFDQLFDIQEGERVPQLGGIREAYVAVTHDTAISGQTAQSRLQEADIQTSTFSFLLGTSMNKRLLKDYQAWPSEWQKFATITPIKDFKVQSRVRLGAFGSLATVAEDAAYATITLTDTQATYSPTKRGNLVAVTRETIINDDLYAIKQIPGKLAMSAAFTLAEFVYGTLLAFNGAVIYDGFKLFDSVNHLNSNPIVANLGTPNSGTALASAALQTAVTKMRRQLNLASKPIGLKPRFLVVPPELEFTAMVISKSAGVPGSNNNDINPMLGYLEVVVAPQIASTTAWMAIADPRVIDTLEVGFVGGQMNPQLFIQDQPLFGNNFTNDVITYKVRHEYGGVVPEYRGFYLGNN